MKTNIPNRAPRTHEGAPAVLQKPIDQLRRTVLACLLWEDGFYESGQQVADRIKTLVANCPPGAVASLALEARTQMRLRHAPLLLARELARHPLQRGAGISAVIEAIIQRADELAEFLALYWKDGRQPLSKQVKLGLAKAFQKFDAYALAKYNRAGSVKLRDVLFLCHAKPKDDEQAALWKRLVDGTLESPDTWEVALSGGADKRETFERLINDGKLGYMALLRNLRNMHEAGVSEEAVRNGLLEGAEKSKALPFRFIAAARAVPAWEPMIEAAMLIAMRAMPKMPGKTVVLVDVSGSMDHSLSAKSDLRRIDAACAISVLIRGIADEVRVFTFSQHLVEVPPRTGMALVDAIIGSQQHSSTYLGAALEALKLHVPDTERLIVITDEQSSDVVGGPGNAAGYMINVADNKNGVGYGDWTRITGFSDAVVQYIQAIEAEKQYQPQEGP